MNNDIIFADSVSLNGRTTADQGLQSTTPANMDDIFVPADFLKYFVSEK